MGDYLQQFSSRTHARIMALRLLYQAEMTSRNVATLLAEDACRFDNEYASLCQEKIGASDITRSCPHFDSCDYRGFFEQYGDQPDPYAVMIAQGVEEKRGAIDEIIESVSEHWHVSRMPVVDRNIVRLATWEILRASPEVPASVAIHEAVQIARAYGGEDSPRFVNGVLGEIYKETALKGTADDAS